MSETPSPEATPDTAGDTDDDPVDSGLVEAFGNRVRKRYRHLKKWAKRGGVTCYRVYEADLPEVPLIVDLYEGRLHIAEWVKKQPLPQAMLAALITAASEALGVGEALVFHKQRDRQRGKRQYERVSTDECKFPVHEGGHQFWVNLSDYVDTGLFLDHRATRAMVQAESAGKDVLNLFAYTGTFTVYAAAGGAKSTTTVDLSGTYLDWAAENFELNGMEDGSHVIVRADVLRWLTEATPESYDLVVLDPPTFSNSKKMRDVLDIQRDHRALLVNVARVTRPGGVVYFSTNFRRFKPDEDAFLSYSTAVEITQQTLPEDFRNKRIHRCWRLVR
ncbi:MAG: 23S rRNA G2069 N7-methylase RlmK/C1962 C5-methylase RlmI [Myxococcota bacterium]